MVSKHKPDNRKQLVPGLCKRCQSDDSLGNTSILKQHGTMEKASLLLNSSYKGHLACVKSCLAAGADVNTGGVSDPYYRCKSVTPLSCAIQSGSEACVKALIKARADVNGKFINAERKRRSPLICAIEVGNTKIIVLIKAGADVNWTFINAEGNKRRPLLYAVELGNTKIVDALIKAGAVVKGEHIAFKRQKYRVSDWSWS